MDSSGKNTGVVAMPSSRGSSRPRDRTASPALAGGFFTAEPLEKDTGFKKLSCAPNPPPMTCCGLELQLTGHRADVCPQLPGERKTGSLQMETLGQSEVSGPGSLGTEGWTLRHWVGQTQWPSQDLWSGRTSVLLPPA